MSFQLKFFEWALAHNQMALASTIQPMGLNVYKVAHKVENPASKRLKDDRFI